MADRMWSHRMASATQHGRRRMRVADNRHVEHWLMACDRQCTTSNQRLVRLSWTRKNIKPSRGERVLVVRGWSGSAHLRIFRELKIPIPRVRSHRTPAPRLRNGKFRHWLLDSLLTASIAPVSACACRPIYADRACSPISGRRFGVFENKSDLNSAHVAHKIEYLEIQLGITCGK